MSGLGLLSNDYWGHFQVITLVIKVLSGSLEVRVGIRVGIYSINTLMNSLPEFWLVLQHHLGSFGVIAGTYY